jgi:hypothetical protein
MHDLSENAAAFDGVSAYDAGDYWHFVAYGLTELYGKGNEDPNLSGFGFELTFKLPKVSAEPALWAFDFWRPSGNRSGRASSWGLATQSRRARSMAGPALAKRRSWWSVMPWFPIRS